MTPEGIERLRRAIVACHYGLCGGWLGERQEHVRFLAFFDYTRDKHLMSEGAFTMFWPHHYLRTFVPCWPEIVQAQN